MRRCKPMKRSRIRPVNTKRRRHRFAVAFHSEAFVAWTKAQPCAACGQRGPSDCAHAKTRGAGGDWTDVLSLCPACHRFQHNVGVESFERAMGVNLTRLAREHHERWLANLAWRAAA